ncbi:uncharacterized protein B0H18DRAFT_994753, partial [Fomitopsis serialis]|uniref:uncharacterized protein n=1 Tax=Fomitopsis serialis TaxID=139415 RepID=UPI0020083996
MKRCHGCQKIYYCGAPCQKAHWREHKDACKRGDHPLQMLRSQRIYSTILNDVIKPGEERRLLEYVHCVHIGVRMSHLQFLIVARKPETVVRRILLCLRTDHCARPPDPSRSSCAVRRSLTECAGRCSEREQCSESDALFLYDYSSTAPGAGFDVAQFVNTDVAK